MPAGDRRGRSPGRRACLMFIAAGPSPRTSSEAACAGWSHWEPSRSAHWPRWRRGCSCPGTARRPRSRQAAIRRAANTCCASAAASSCHTDEKNGGAFLAGGRALGSPFGTFYTSNITPDPATGIGGWSTGAFVRAMTEGVSPGGHPYFPAFPYPSYTKAQLEDLVDLKAYLDTVKPVANDVRGHDLRFPFGFRPLLKGWQLLFFDEGHVPARSGPIGDLEPRRLHRERPRPLQRMPHAAQRPRRAQTRPLPRRHPRRPGRQAGAQHHAA